MALRALRMRILNYPLFLSEKGSLEKGKNGIQIKFMTASLEVSLSIRRRLKASEGNCRHFNLNKI